jgi:hypothetical protein
MKKILYILLFFIPLTSWGQIPSIQANGILLSSACDSVGQLQKMTPFHSAWVNVRGFYNPGDGGGGLFHWVDTSTATPVTGIIIQINGVTTGRFFRQYDLSNGYNALWFGCKRTTYADTVTDNSQYVRTARNFIFTQGASTGDPFSDVSYGSIIFFPQGIYVFKDSVNMLVGQGIKGAGSASTVFVCNFESPTFTHPTAYKNLFTCFGGGSGGTGLPPVISSFFGYNTFEDFSITSQYSDGGSTTPLHWGMKYGIQLRNGFYLVRNVFINSADSAGIMGYELIGTEFDRVQIQNCGYTCFWLTYDPANPTNVTTTTNWINCAFSNTRRGPNFYCNTPVISSAFYNTLFQSAGIEDSVLGQGALIMGDSTKTTFTALNTRLTFYNCDFERNLAEMMLAENSEVNVIYPRVAGVAAAGLPNWYIRNCIFTLKSQFYAPITVNAPGIMLVSRPNQFAMNVVIDDKALVNNGQIAVFDTTGTTHPLTWLRFANITCENSGGTEDQQYMGSLTGTFLGNYLFTHDSTMLDSTVLTNSTSSSLVLLGADTARDAGTGQLRVFKYHGTGFVTSVTSPTGSLTITNTAGAVHADYNFGYGGTYTVNQNYSPSLQTANTTAPGVTLLNSTAATSGNQSESPATYYTGQVFNTTSSASQAFGWRMYATGTQGATPSTTMKWDYFNGSGYSNLGNFTSAGLFSAPLVNGTTSLLGGIGGQVGTASVSIKYGNNLGIGFGAASGSTGQGAAINANGTTTGSGADLQFIVVNSSGTAKTVMQMIGQTGHVWVGNTVDDGDPIDLLTDSLNLVVGDTIKGNGAEILLGQLSVANMTGDVSASMVPTGLDTTTGKVQKMWNLAPRIVASGDDSNNVNVAIGGIINYTTPPGSHSYWVAGYINATASTANSLQMTVNYTDPHGNANVVNLGAPVVTVSRADFSPIEIRTKSGTAIGISVTFTGGTATYDAGGTAMFIR